MENGSAEKRLLTIASGKGGVGKTWLSVTLAHALSKRSRKVVLFDGDLGLANVDIQLGMMPDRDLGMFITGDATLKDVCVPHRDKDGDGFDVIAGRSGSGALGNLTKERLLQIRSSLIGLGADYDHVMLDLAAGIDPSVTTLSQHKGMVLVVMTGDPTSLTDAYAFIKVTHQRNPSADIRIAVNNVPTKQAGDKAYEAIKRACEGFLKFTPPLMGIVHQDDKVTDAIRNQTPLFDRHPQSKAADDVMRLADAIIKA